MDTQQVKKEYGQVEISSDEVGVLDVIVKEGNYLKVSVLFYDTREVEPEFWVPQRVVNQEFGLIAQEDDIGPKHILSPTENILEDLWMVEVYVCDTPSTRGLIEELSNFEQWVDNPVGSRGLYLGKLIGNLLSLRE